MSDLAQRKKIKTIKISTKAGLERAEREFRVNGATEIYPWAINTPFITIAEDIFPDKRGKWETPLFAIICECNPVNGAYSLCRKADEFLRTTYRDGIDTLSISSYMKNDILYLLCVVRLYEGNIKQFTDFFKEIGESLYREEDDAPTPGQLVIPEEIKNFSYTQEQVAAFKEKLDEQKQVLDKCSEEHPFLNSIKEYIPHKMPRPEDKMDFIYDLETNDKNLKTITPYNQFNMIFKEIMNRFSDGVDKYDYFAVLKEERPKESFFSYVEQVIIDEYVDTGRMRMEDVPVLKKKLNKALFKLYIIQDLIDDPNVTDINITAPNSIRARVQGKTYLSNISFVNTADYIRFVDALAIKNNILLNVPIQTFTDSSDENYLLRFTISADYVNSADYPYLHIRKINRHKMLGDDLIKAGMFDEKIKNYLLDAAKTSRGVVFAGPPGSGKTIGLNWFLEEGYESSADIYVIQENDELFAYRKGVKFQHVVNYCDDDKVPVDLEELGRLALVAGANVFIIGEAKGPEICSAITLSNSGCRTAITIHSPSAKETIDKMADLALRGYAKDYEQAKRMIKSFQTIVYMQDFKIQEITEIIGYDEEKKDMIYRCIYKRPKEENI